jgi:alginate O-acetyltransferase complex protein AlgI
MVFTSFAFLEFFVVILAGLYLLPSRPARQLLILLGSIFFYAYWNPYYVIVLAVPSVIDYFCAIQIEDSKFQRIRKFWLVFSLVTNFGLLAYFKYTNFFIANFSNLLDVQPHHLDIVLPIGISFFTFKTMSYTIDVYRREIPACRSLWKYAMFVTYFPELVAGPIVRASIFLPQMERSLKPSCARAIVGLQIVLLGVTKKIVIADRLALFVDPVFANPGGFSQVTVINAVIAYSIQIYCDFSGYSDIAIGVSKIIGFDLPENFNMPYLATSITDFWRRWHITLSSWLRDYLYIPLGGNRKGRWRTYINLMLTMLLGGLWHGASWTFVFWGLLHGIALATHKMWTEKTGGRYRPFNGVIGWAATYTFVCVAWVFFRAESFSIALIVLRKMAGLSPGGVQWIYSPLYPIVLLVILGHAIGYLAARQAKTPGSVPRRIPPPNSIKGLYSDLRNRFAFKPARMSGIYVLLPIPGFVGAFVLTCWLLIILLFSSLNTSPFIYFQF